MTYAFRPDDPTVEAGLRRIADAVLSEALAELAGEGPVGGVVAGVRARLRGLRGLLKIVRPVFPAYGVEAATLRDAGRAVSDLHDSATMAGIADRARPWLSTLLSPGLAEDLHALLERDREEVEAREDVPVRLHRVKVALLSVSERSGSWALAAEEGTALSGGLSQTCCRAQSALAIAGRRRGAEDFAALRRQVRYHRCHAELLRPMMEGPIAAHLALADAALETLAAHRDLAILPALLNRLQGRLSPQAQSGAARAIAARRAAMEPVILGLARALLAEEPEALAGRFVTYWEVRRSGSLDPGADAPPRAIAAL